MEAARLTAVLFLLSAAAAAAAEAPRRRAAVIPPMLRSQEPGEWGWAGTRFFGGAHGGWVSRTEARAALFSGLYEVSARLHAHRDRGAYDGTSLEWAVGARRILYHSSIGFRVGGKPPNTERSSYRLTQVETTVTFYGLRLGPEHPEMAETLWEDSPKERPAALDERWISALHARYTRSDHKVARSRGGTLGLTQHTSQFELRGIWRRRTSVALECGFNVYDLALVPQDDAVHLDNVQYAGGVFPVRGWPNQNFGFSFWHKFGERWRLEGGFTRLTLLDREREALGALSLEWAPKPRWRISFGGHHRRRFGHFSRYGLSLGGAYLW